MEPKTALRPPGSNGAYARMAPFYDHFSAHHDYELWLSHLLPAAEAAGLSGTRVLDVGCGTGKSFLPLLEAGWSVTACDASPEMLEVAREKVGPEARIEVADMRTLPVLGEFDLVMSLGDVTNYMVNPGDIGRAVAAMAANLAPGGVLLFDANTLVTYRTFYSELSETTVEGLSLRWEGLAGGDTAPGEIAEARFRVAGGEEEALDAGVHRQRHIPEEEMRRAIRSAGLREPEVYGHGFDAVLRQPLREEVHTKAIYITGFEHEGEERR